MKTIRLHVVLLVLTSCAPVEPPRSAAGPADIPPAADTLRGTLAIVGAEPLTRPALRPRAGGPEVYLTGPGAENADRFDGLDVRVDGRLGPEGGEMEVERVTVRGIQGMLALDGVLVRENGGWALRVEEGRSVPLRNVPPALQEHEGSRVWVAAPVDAGAGSFGVVGPTQPE